MIDVTILSGSSRPDNNTYRVALALKRISEEHGATADVIDFKDYDIPFLNKGGLHPEALTPFQDKLIKSMDNAHLVIIVSPEYNWFPSAELVNMIHQLGSKTYRHLFDKKVFSFVGVSSGRGGRIPTIQLGYVIDKLINVFETESVTCPKKFESQFSTHALDSEGNSMGNKEYDHGITKYLEYSLNLAKKWQMTHS